MHVDTVNTHVVSAIINVDQVNVQNVVFVLFCTRSQWKIMRWIQLMMLFTVLSFRFYCFFCDNHFCVLALHRTWTRTGRCWFWTTRTTNTTSSWSPETWCSTRAPSYCMAVQVSEICVCSSIFSSLHSISFLRYAVLSETVVSVFYYARIWFVSYFSMSWLFFVFIPQRCSRGATTTIFSFTTSPSVAGTMIGCKCCCFEAVCRYVVFAVCRVL